jgi:hypothetical protein
MAAAGDEEEEEEVRMPQHSIAQHSIWHAWLSVCIDRHRIQPASVLHC